MSFLWLKKVGESSQEQWGFVLPIFWGPFWYAPWLPRRTVALHTVAGAPLVLPRIPQPTTADVETWHAAYITSLRDIFDTHKARFGYEHRELEIL